MTASSPSRIQRYLMKLPATAIACFGVALAGASSLYAAEATHKQILSPSERVEFEYWLEDGRLVFSVSHTGHSAIERSEVSFLVDGVDLTADVEPGAAETYELDERYPWRGGHSEAVNHCRGAKIPLLHTASGQSTTFEVRVFDDGIAYRHLAPGEEKQRVPDELTRIVLPAGSRAWFHDLESHYEGIYQFHPIEQITEGQWVAPPVTFKLADDAGYVAITEAALTDYSGMALEADGQRGFRIALGHRQHVSYPFRLRYPDDVERLQQPAAIEGDIISPWRVVIVSEDLNGLVNSDIIANCNPPADPELFPEGFATPWVKPGRAVWKYLDGGESTLAGVKQFSELAGKLGFEYQVVEGFWRRWSDDEITEAVEHAQQHDVGLFFWVHSRDLRTAEAREELFARLNRLGVAGAKIDFFDHEHREIVDLYTALLEEAARNKVLVNFHGANKPTGTERTWPNELVREGVRGAEYRKPPERATHNATLPFTRYLAGQGEYTPVIFGERRCDTTWAHQVATAAAFTHPLLTYAANPQTLLDCPASELVRTLPSVWDETIVLPQSEIGQCAALARRRGEEWFVTLLNGGAARTEQIELSFLTAPNYTVASVADDLQNPEALIPGEQVVGKGDTLRVEMAAGGGYLAKLSPTGDPSTEHKQTALRN